MSERKSESGTATVESEQSRDEVGSYLARCLGAYLDAGDVDDANARRILEGFCRFVTSGRCGVEPPRRECVRLRTPDGDLVAYPQDLGDYRAIVIDLERRDGGSGQVCMAEWVAEPERGPAMDYVREGDGGGVARRGTEPVYPTPFHTFAYDGDADEPSAAVDLNPFGAEMWYRPRGAGAGNPSLSDRTEERLDDEVPSHSLPSAPER